MVDFIYSGEIRLSAQDLAPFMALTNYLKIRGLNKDQGWSSEQAAAAAAKLDSEDQGTKLADQIKVDPKRVDSKRVNSKKRRERSKDKAKKILINSWTSNLDDKTVNGEVKDKPQDETDAQDVTSHSGQHVSSDLADQDPGQSTLNGLRMIKFQCHQCMEVFSEKLAFVQHVIRAHKLDKKPKEGLNNDLIINLKAA